MANQQLYDKSWKRIQKHSLKTSWTQSEMKRYPVKQGNEIIEIKKQNSETEKFLQLPSPEMGFEWATKANQHRQILYQTNNQTAVAKRIFSQTSRHVNIQQKISIFNLKFCGSFRLIISKCLTMNTWIFEYLNFY